MKKERKKIKRQIIWILIILIMAVIGLITYFYLIKSKKCENEDCFFNSMAKCRKVYLIREDSEAVWNYQINGKGSGDSCDVGVRLLLLKQGTIENEKLQGKSMSCILKKTERNYPEKNLQKCTGILKEEMQEIIINRMHNYLLKNIGEIKGEFGAV